MAINKPCLFTVSNSIIITKSGDRLCHILDALERDAIVVSWKYVLPVGSFFDCQLVFFSDYLKIIVGVIVLLLVKSNGIAITKIQSCSKINKNKRFR
jgi:hypothetical protein